MGRPFSLRDDAGPADPQQVAPGDPITIVGGGDSVGIDASGAIAIPKLLEATRGRCRGLHFGLYDYTASCNITAEHQTMTHPACDFARHVMQVSAAGRGVTLSDGATNIMPIPRHRAAAGSSLSTEQMVENRTVVHRAMRLHFEHVQRSLTDDLMREQIRMYTES